MDPFTTAVIGWATNQVGAAGMQGLRRLLGDKQRNSLRKGVHLSERYSFGGVSVMLRG